MGQDVAYATQHIRNLCGGSQPILVGASDGLRYVVKFTNNQQGPNLLFNESMGSELYQCCGLPVPAWRPLLLTEAFLEKNRSCWMRTDEGIVRPDPGLCFGSLYLGETNRHLLEILPGTSFKRVRNHRNFWLAWLIDICAQHTDNRQAIFQEDGEGQFNAIFFDHGHLFGGPKGEQKLNFQASRYLDPRIYQDVFSMHQVGFAKGLDVRDVDQIWQRCQTLPEKWKTESAHAGLEQCLNRLANATLLQNILDTMVDAHQRTKENGRKQPKSERTPRKPVLRPGVQAARPEHRTISGSLSHPACA
jgi:hypothetical protein